MQTLIERIHEYERTTDYRLTRRLPIVIKLNGRSFKKTTSLLTKPFASEFTEVMCAVSLKLAQEIDGTVFIYSFNDQIAIILRNDQRDETEAWYDNCVQKISSAAASLATLEFNRMSEIGGLKIVGDPIFTAHSFVLPNIVEVINLLVSLQQEAFQTSISMSCFYELLKRYSLEEVKQLTVGKSWKEKLNLLSKYCGVSMNDYPSSFARGIACYRSLKVVKTDYGDDLKSKLIIDTELPIFTENHNFLSGIFKSGSDIIRIRDDV